LCPMLPVCLDCPLLTSLPSVFFNI
jgi:hypothetical protein